MGQRAPLDIARSKWGVGKPAMSPNQFMDAPVQMLQKSKKKALKRGLEYIVGENAIFFFP